MSSKMDLPPNSARGEASRLLGSLVHSSACVPSHSLTPPTFYILPRTLSMPERRHYDVDPKDCTRKAREGTRGRLLNMSWFPG